MGKILKLVTGVLFVSALAACGGGGGSTPTANNVTVSGIVSKGPVQHATVRAFGLDANGKKIMPAFAIATTATNGSYHLPAFNHSGIILIETTGGTYTDEATGASKTNPGLKAILPSASGAVTLPVTPLTHLAFTCASSATTGLTATNIAKANKTVTTAFGIDIINTSPVNAADSTQITASTTTQQVQYGVMLAAVSKVGFTNFLSGTSTDLVKATPQLSTATSNSLTTAISDLVNAGKLDHTVSAINTATAAVSNVIANNAATPILVDVNTDAVANAKALVTDLRNTALSFYNYTSGKGSSGMNAVLLTPYNALSNEVTTKINPELAAVAEQIGRIAEGAYLPQNDTTYSSNGFTYTVSTSGTSKTITVKNSSDTTVASGTVTANSFTQPTAGTVTATLTTPNGTATFSGEVSNLSFDANQNLTGIALYGTFVTKDGAGTTVLTCALGSASNKVTATFGHDAAQQSTYLTSLSFNGRLTSATTEISGSISLPTLVMNNNLGSSIPKSATVTGTFKALNSNGLVMTGTLQGNLSNAATIAKTATPTNFPLWDASFTGSIVANGGVNVSSTLTAGSTTYQQVQFTVQFQRTRPNGTKFTLSGTGTYNGSNDTMTVQITNQDGLAVNLSFDKAKAESFTGNVTVSKTDTTKVAVIYLMNSIPSIKFADNYFESIF